MPLVGADPEEIGRLAATFSTNSQTVAEVLSAVQRALGSLSWRGPDADRFASEWHARQAGLNALRAQLGDAAETLRREAREQMAASGVVGAAIARETGILRGGGDVRAALNDLFGVGNLPGAQDEAASAFHERFRAEEAARLRRVLGGEGSLDDLKPDATSLLRLLSSEFAGGGTSWSEGSEWQRMSTVDAPWGPLALRADAFAGTQGHLSGYAGMQDGQLVAGAELSAMAGVNGSVEANTNVAGFVPVGVKGEAFVGGRAEASVSGAAGLDGVEGTGEVDAFLGAEANAEGSAALGDYAQAGGSAGASFGLGASGGASGNLTGDKVGLSGDFTVAFGPGVTFSYDLSVNPTAIAGDLEDAASEVVGAAEKLLDGSGVSSVSAVVKKIPVLGGLF